ncbi:Polysaccharide biosynthesis protein [Candidatus Magnetomoraceae bacterium gMMP-15]
MKSTIIWLFIHIIFPLLPFFIQGFLRYIIMKDFTLDTFSASTLSMSQGLIYMFIGQCILNTELILPNQDKKDEQHCWVKVCYSIAIIFFALFGAIVFCEALIEFRNLPVMDILISLKRITFCSALVLILTIYLQSSFKLKVST